MKTFILSLLLVTGCHATESEVQATPVPVKPAATVVVDVFGSYTCGICTEELPALHERMVAYNATHKSQILVRLFVVSGKGNSMATQEVADNYARDLGLTTFQPHPDNRCRGAYQQYYPKQGCYIPAHVILPVSGKPLVYPQGAVNLDKFMRDLQEVVGE